MFLLVVEPNLFHRGFTNVMGCYYLKFLSSLS